MADLSTNDDKNELSNLEIDNDDIPEPIQVLDDILSEFEEPESLPPVPDQESPLQGNQSEDDGYMSMNGRRTTKISTPLQEQKFGPVVESSDSGNCEIIEDEKDDGNIIQDSNFDGTQEEKEVYSPLQPLKNNVFDEVNSNAESNNTNFASNVSQQDKVTNDVNISQTTLPKVRTTACIPSKYSSLPCSGAHKLGDIGISSGSFDGERNVLGIDISAVHNAVIRGGVAKLPEPIVNEHPVTIYPGRVSPSRSRVPPRTLANSVEKHREVCRSVHLPSQNESEILLTNVPNNSPLKRLFASASLCANIEAQIPNQQKIIISDSLKNFEKLEISLKCNNGAIKKHRIENSTDDDFSDDSLEEQSLPPPPAPPTVPPTPSLSAPATPRKRGSISWEISLDDIGDSEKNSFSQRHKINPRLKKSASREKQLNTCIEVSKTKSEQSNASISESQSSATSSENGREHLTAAQHQMQVYSTEDEATSIYSDAEDIIPAFPANMVGKGTFIIRKGRKERQHLSEMFVKSSSIHSHMSLEGNPNYQGQNLLISNSRHSIDLGLSHHFSNSREQVAHSPRSRLSLDLGSPTLETPIQHQQLLENKCIVNKNPNLNLCVEHSSKSLRNPTDYNAEKPTKNGSDGCLNNIKDNIGNSYSAGLYSLSNSNPNVSSSSIVRQQTNSGDLHTSNATTPRRELAPPLEEDEEQYSESQSGCAPLRQIENNISALLRGDISVARVGDITQQRRSLGFRPGVHKSESAKEMLLSQNAFGPLPPTPTSSSPELVDSDGLPPLPPSPTDIEDNMDSDHITSDIQEIKSHSQLNHFGKYTADESLPPPAIPPHRSPMPSNTMKTRSMDGGYSKKCGKSYGHGSIPGTLPCDMPISSSIKRNLPGSYSRRTPPTQTPREEVRLQTSCSLPETPIFARGCDIARTPHRRPTEPTVGSVSRTTPRSSTNVQNMNFGSSIVGIGVGNTLSGCRQRTLSQALQTGEMLRLTGGPARGWYPKQRSMRPASTENLDHLHRLQQSTSMRAWDGTTGMSGTAGSRKPLTLPPNLTPTFLNKSPREALRRVTSLLIKKGNTKERDSKRNKDTVSPQTGSHHVDSSKVLSKESTSNFNNNLHKSQKKKGFFKNFWKKSKHYSLDQ